LKTLATNSLGLKAQNKRFSAQNYTIIAVKLRLRIYKFILAL